MTAIACTSSPTQVTPKLPLGFAEAKVARDDASGYLYASHQPPIGVNIQRFGNPFHATDNPRFARIPEVLELIRISVLSESSFGSFGGSLRFNNPSGSYYGDIQAEIAQDVMQEFSDVTVWRDERELHFVRGKDGWADALKSDLEAGQGATLEEAYPDLWELFQVYPQSPAQRPVAAGFIFLQGGLLEEGLGKAGISISGLTQALGSIQVSRLTYLAYAGEDMVIGEHLNAEALAAMDASLLAVMRSEYPGFLLSFFLGSFGDSLGLEKTTIASGQEIFFKEADGLHLLVKSIGSVIFMAIAPEKANAEALMVSVLEQQE